MKYESKEIKLDMTPEEVKAILGEPEKVEEDSWYITFYYVQKEPYIRREIKFARREGRRP
jgi:hypothetical protein